MTVINLTNFLLMTGHLGGDDRIDFGRGMYLALEGGYSNLHVSADYTGPDINEIANIEDISF